MDREGGGGETSFAKEKGASTNRVCIRERKAWSGKKGDQRNRKPGRKRITIDS